MKSVCSAYLVSRVIIGFLDTVSDILLCVHLVLEEHYLWAALIGSWILTGFIFSFLAVVTERCRRQIPLSSCKYLLLTWKIHTEYGQAFYQAGPQLLTQLVLFWTGVHLHEFQV